jgi:hypothetical protein
MDELTDIMTNFIKDALLEPKMIICSVCGGTAFAEHSILRDKLVSEWQLALRERNYIDRQQRTCCTSCAANLRSIALADAIRAVMGPP